MVDLLSGHREPNDVGMGTLGGVAGDAQSLFDAEVLDRGDEDATFDPGLAARVVDTAGDPAEVLLVTEADERRMVGRGRELDIDRTFARATAQIFET